MPAAGIVATTLTTPGSAPFSLFVGPYDLLSTVGSNLPGVDVGSIRFEDNGAAEVGHLELDVIDMALASVVGDCAPIRFEDNVAVKTRWVGEVTDRSPTIIASGRAIHVTGTHVGMYLDKSNVPNDYRNNDSATFKVIGIYAESDQQRLGWLLAVYGDRLGSRDASMLARLLAFTQGGNTGTILPVQRFQGLTLRQAIEQVEGQISTTLTATYYISGPGRLHHLDGSSGDMGAAPYAIRIGTPGGGEIAPEDLNIQTDSLGLINAYYVKGATAAGSGWVTDPASILAYGRHEDYIDAPDADTSTKRDAVGLAALSDTKSPVQRGSFSVKSPYDGWMSGQTLTINSAPQFGISSPTTYRTTAVVTTFLSGAGDRQYEVSFGAQRASYLRQN